MGKLKQKYYVVWRGVCPGIYEDWTECKLQIEGFEGALYKSFASRAEAEAALRASPYEYIGKRAASSSGLLRREGPPPYIVQSLAVDAACSGNPGDMEYRGVYVETGQEIFRVGPMAQGTNNIGEFLALVHGLALFKKSNCAMPIYSDSRNAMGATQKMPDEIRTERR